VAYEYKLVRLRISPETEAILNALGAGGWRLAGIGDGYAIFRRRVHVKMEPDVPRNDPGRCEIEKTDGG
jgi:hypothetical protein